MSHTKIGGTGAGGKGGGGSNSIDFILFYNLHQFSLGSSNKRDMILLMIGDSNICLLTMIKGTLIQDIGKKDIGAFCCYLVHGTTIRTGITCKKIPCYMRNSACRWFIVKIAKIF